MRRSAGRSMRIIARTSDCLNLGGHPRGLLTLLTLLTLMTHILREGGEGGSDHLPLPPGAIE